MCFFFGYWSRNHCSLWRTMFFETDYVTFSVLLWWEVHYLGPSPENSDSFKPLLSSATIANGHQKTFFHIYSFKTGCNNTGEESAINTLPLTESTRLDCMGTSVECRWALSLASHCMGKEVLRMCPKAFFPPLFELRWCLCCTSTLFWTSIELHWLGHNQCSWQLLWCTLGSIWFNPQL